MKNKITLIALIIILILTNIFWYFKNSSLQTKLVSTQVELNSIIKNKKVVAFQKLFVDKVLMSDGNVDFNTRVELQNAVTGMSDELIEKVWGAFLTAKTEGDAQNRVKELLSLLASKIYTN
jgi:hypothetical protein